MRSAASSRVSENHQIDNASQVTLPIRKVEYLRLEDNDYMPSHPGKLAEMIRLPTVAADDSAPETPI